MSFKRLSFIPFVCALLGGCASYLTTFSSDVADPKENKVYRGTREYIKFLGEPYSCTPPSQRPSTEPPDMFECILTKFGFGIYFIIDATLSFTLDTLLLPYTIPKSIANAHARENADANTGANDANTGANK